MASFELYTDPLVSCPYNPAHRLKKSRMQIHLTKCKKNYVEKDLKPCPFNEQHRIEPSEYQYHLSRCPDKRLVERKVTYASEDKHQGNTTVPSYKVDTPAADEYWDEIPSTQPGYDPRKKLESGNYILIPKGAPAEKRNAYKNMFSAVHDLNANSVARNTSSMNAKPLPPPEPKPMREPKSTPEVIQHTENLGRGQIPSGRRKIAANIFGGSAGRDTSAAPADVQIGIGRGNPALFARGIGRGNPAPTPGFPGSHPPLAPGQMQLLNDRLD